jgi:hypothetical protein
MFMTKDALDMLQREIEAMAEGFISGPILMSISGPILMRIRDYMKLLQKGNAAKSQ